MYYITQIALDDIVENVLVRQLTVWQYPTFALYPRNAARWSQDHARKYVCLPTERYHLVTECTCQSVQVQITFVSTTVCRYMLVTG